MNRQRASLFLGLTLLLGYLPTAGRAENPPQPLFKLQGVLALLPQEQLGIEEQCAEPSCRHSYATLNMSTLDQVQTNEPGPWAQRSSDPDCGPGEDCHDRIQWSFGYFRCGSSTIGGTRTAQCRWFTGGSGPTSANNGAAWAYELSGEWCEALLECSGGAITCKNWSFGFGFCRARYFHNDPDTGHVECQGENPTQLIYCP